VPASVTVSIARGEPITPGVAQAWPVTITVTGSSVALLAKPFVFTPRSGDLIFSHVAAWGDLLAGSNNLTLFDASVRLDMRSATMRERFIEMVRTDIKDLCAAASVSEGDEDFVAIGTETETIDAETVIT
jgi:hypothetical protein